MKRSLKKAAFVVAALGLLASAAKATSHLAARRCCSGHDCCKGDACCAGDSGCSSTECGNGSCCED